MPSRSATDEDFEDVPDVIFIFGRRPGAPPEAPEVEEVEEDDEDDR